MEAASMSSNKKIIFACLLAFAIAVELSVAVITVQIGGATRLNSLSRQRDRYNCYWDCDLVGCQIARDDDECAYDCEKICRIRYDYSGRSGSSGVAGNDQLGPKSDAPSSKQQQPADGLEAEKQPATGAEMLGAGQSVRLHLPRNASARNFAIWERCSADSSTGKLTELPFSL